MILGYPRLFDFQKLPYLTQISVKLVIYTLHFVKEEKQEDYTGIRLSKSYFLNRGRNLGNWIYRVIGPDRILESLLLNFLISYMRKLRHREVESLSQHNTAFWREKNEVTPGLLTPRHLGSLALIT